MRKDPRCRAGAGLATVGAAFVFLGGRDLVAQPSDPVARWLVYLGLALLVAGALLVADAWRRARAVVALSEGGVAVRARVTEVERDWLSRGYALRYLFDDAMGQRRQGLKIVSQREAFTWREGDEGDARYDPGDPATSVWIGREVELDEDEPAVTAAVLPESARPDAVPLGAPTPPSTWALVRRSPSLRSAALASVYVVVFSFFLLLLAVFEEAPSDGDRLGFALFSLLVAGVVVLLGWRLWAGWREVAGWRRIASRGFAVEGVVSLVEEKRKRLGRWTWTPGWIVTYRYRDAGGELHDGESGYLSRRQASRWRCRDRCLILCDPERPELSVWLGRG